MEEDGAHWAAKHANRGINSDCVCVCSAGYRGRCVPSAVCLLGSYACNGDFMVLFIGFDSLKSFGRYIE